MSERQRVLINTVKKLVEELEISKTIDAEIQNKYRSLAKEQKALHGLTEVMYDRMPQDKYDDLLQLTARMDSLLNKIYEALTNQACKDIIKFNERMRIHVSGHVDQEFYEHQEMLIRYILRSVIYGGDYEDYLSLLLSRGSGKTYTLAKIIVFLSLYWSNYIYHTSSSDFTILVTAGSDKSLVPFKAYIKEAFSICQDMKLISKKESDTSELSLWTSVNNDAQFTLKKRGKGDNYLTIHYRMLAPSMEGVHANLVFIDEAKFAKRDIVLESLIPCSGQKLGRNIFLSSASEKVCFFENLVKSNYKKDLEDAKKDKIKISERGKFNEEGFDFVGKRLFIMSYKTIMQYDPKYAKTISKAVAISGETAEEKNKFLTQYGNVFLGKKDGNFFNVDAMLSTGQIQKNVRWEDYAGNNKYMIIAGWDIATNGEDSSILTIKAVPNIMGADRDSVLLNQICLNPNRNPLTENLYDQVDVVYKWLKVYGVTAIAIDTTSIGNSADVYLKKKIRERNDNTIHPSNIIGVPLSKKSKFEVLEGYFNRIQSGKEKFGYLSNAFGDADGLEKDYYRNYLKYDDTSMMLKMYLEHMRFEREETDGEVRYSTPEKSIHDDTILSSALCSHLLEIKPQLCNRNVISGNGSGISKTNTNRKFGNVLKRI